MYRVIEITIDADKTRLVKSATQLIEPVASERPNFHYGELVVLGCHLIHSDGTDYVLNAGDTFDFGMDTDYHKDLDDGTASADYSGAVTEIEVTGLTSTIPLQGYIQLINEDNNSDVVAYTDYASGVFTVSATLTYAYTTGDTVTVLAPLMAYSKNTMVDIAGDWDEIDRATGRISIRINCLTPTFLDKISQSIKGELITQMQIRRVPYTMSDYTTVCQDWCTSDDSVIGIAGSAGENIAEYLTVTQGDARYLGIQSVGPTGATGVQGDSGIDGLQGTQGPLGLQGLGNLGVQGLQGDAGTDGVQGAQGLGFVGTQGLQGPLGLQGSGGVSASLQNVNVVIKSIFDESSNAFINYYQGIQYYGYPSGVQGSDNVFTATGCQTIMVQGPQGFVGAQGGGELPFGGWEIAYTAWDTVMLTFDDGVQSYSVEMAKD